MNIVDDDIIDQIYYYIPNPYYHKITFYMLESVALMCFVVFGSVNVIYSFMLFALFNLLLFSILTCLVPFFIQIQLMLYYKKSDV